MKDKDIKVVFIDWYGTLSVSKFWYQFENPEHKYHAYSARLDAVIRSQGTQIVKPWMKGELSSEAAIRKIAKAANISYDFLYAEFVRSVSTMKLVSGALALVERIRSQGVAVAIATDNMDSFTRWTVPTLNLRQNFDYILNSSSLKCLKAEKSTEGESLFFSRFIRDHALYPNQCMLLDDSLTIGPVVESYGMKYVSVEFGVGLVSVLTDLLS
jgi:FMN phosphatase YigB (HAD superfamily)